MTTSHSANSLKRKNMYERWTSIRVTPLPGDVKRMRHRCKVLQVTKPKKILKQFLSVLRVIRIILYTYIYYSTLYDIFGLMIVIALSLAVK